MNRIIDYNCLVWNKWLNIGAINCAQQDCRDFNIQGTPTVRAFGPGYQGTNNNETDIGRDIPARHEVEYWYETILSLIEDIQEEDEIELENKSGVYTRLIDKGLPNLTPYRCFSSSYNFLFYLSKYIIVPKIKILNFQDLIFHCRKEDSIYGLFSSTKGMKDYLTYASCNDKQYLVAILESTGYHGIGRSDEDNRISRLAILEHYTIFQDLKINRVLTNDTDEFLRNLNLFFEFEIINKEHAIDLTDSSKRPGLLIYTISGDNTTGR